MVVTKYLSQNPIFVNGIFWESYAKYSMYWGKNGIHTDVFLHYFKVQTATSLFSIEIMHKIWQVYIYLHCK